MLSSNKIIFENTCPKCSSSIIDIKYMITQHDKQEVLSKKCLVCLYAWETLCDDAIIKNRMNDTFRDGNIREIYENNG